MRTLRRLAAGTVAALMASALPLGVAAQTDSVVPAGQATDAAGKVSFFPELVYATASAPDKATELKLSLYLPEGSKDPPMVVDLGGTVNAYALAERGVAVMQLRPPDRFWAFMDDADPTAVRTMVEAVACGVRYARGSEHGSETAPLVLTGFSRLGATAAHVALAGESFERVWEEYEAVGGPPAQWDCTAAGASTRVDGLVGVGGGYDAFVGYELETSPYGRIHLLEHEPDLWAALWSTVGLHPELRVRLLHGTSDKTIPMEVSTAFEAVLAEAGYDVELLAYESGHSIPADLMMQTVVDLVAE